MNNEIEQKAVKFEARCKDVLQWAGERDLLKFENASRQALKVIEELGEFVGAYLKGKELEMQKEFGDVIVTVVILCAQIEKRIGVILTDCCISYGVSFSDTIEYIRKDKRNTIAGVMENVGRIILTVDGYINDFYADSLEQLTTNLLERILIFARLNELDALHCFELAYDNIKNRQGKTENGIFIKQEDLQKGGEND